MVMVTLLLIALVAGSSLWVYLDATKNRIGKIPGTESFFNLSAGAWGVVTLGMWLIAFPSYLIKRRELIEVARSHPIEPTRRLLKAVLFAAVGVGWLALAFILFVPRLPGCASRETLGLLERVLRELPAAKSGELVIRSVGSPTELSFDRAAERRTCETSVETQMGVERAIYVVEWQTKEAAIFQIRLVPTDSSPR